MPDSSLDIRQFGGRLSREFHLSAIITMLLIGGVGAFGLVAGSHADAPVQTVPASITADCSVNVTDALNSWIASVGDGSTLQFGGGCYRIDQTLLLTNRNNVTIDGGGATFKAIDPTGNSSTVQSPDNTAAHRSQWHVSGGTNISFQNMTVIGVNPNDAASSNGYYSPLEHQHAFWIDGTQGLTISHTTAMQTYGDAVYLNNGPAGAANNIKITDNTFHNDGRNNISIVGANNVTIESNTIDDAHYSIVDMEPNGAKYGATNVLINNNSFGHVRNIAIAGEGLSGPVSNVTITNNHLHGQALTIAAVHKSPIRSNWTVSGNVSDQSWGGPGPAGAMSFGGINNVTVTNNTQPLQAGRGDSGVAVNGATNVTVSGNSFIGAVSTVYVNPAATSTIAANCGNQLVAKATFAQPQICTQPAAPPQAPGGGNGSGGNTTTGQAGQSNTSVKSTTTTGTSKSTTSSKPGTTTGHNNSATTAHSGVSGTTNSLLEQATNSHEPIKTRLSASLKLYGSLVVVLLLTLLGVRRLLHLLLPSFKLRYNYTHGKLVMFGDNPVVAPTTDSQASPRSPQSLPK